jgi:alanine racemase
VLARLRDCPGIDPDICLMTHLACADDLSSSVTDEQLQVFAATIGDWDGDVSIANSAGILGWPASTRPGQELCYAGRNWVRPGLMLYGVSPLMGRTAEECGLVPAMVLEGRLLTVREIPAGAAVGYGAQWRAQRDSRIGIVNIGYADGYAWRLSNRARAQVAGRPAPVVGRVSMDMICIDLTEFPAVRTGDRVTLWGDEPAVAELADRAGTSAYELLTGVGRRVRRTHE